ncbi:MAG: alpha/beta fold hydrolase [Nannocystaceae bacterium]
MPRAPDVPLESLLIDGPEGQLHVMRSPGPAPAERPPILFAHGYPDSWRTWIRQLEALGRDRPVAAFDLRGAGRSTPPTSTAGFAIDRVLPDFIAVIDALVGPAGQVHLVAHDWGGALAWALASEPTYARRLRSLTTVAGPHPDLFFAVLRDRLRSGRLADLRFVAGQLRRSWYMFAFQVPGLAEAMFRRDPVGQSIRAHRRGGVPRDEVADHVDPETIVADTTGILGLYRQAFRDLVRGRRRARRPSRITTPTLAIVPRQDMALAPQLYDNLPEYVDALDLRYIDANHWAHAQRPEIVNGLIAAHVAAHDG